MRVVRFDHDQVLTTAFLDLPARVYAADPHWIPPFKDAVRAQLSPEAPFFRHGEMTHFLAFEGEVPVARCSAILNSRYEEDGAPIGFIGYFEALDRPEASRAVLGEAVAWLRERGARLVRGPVNTSTYHPYRLMTEGFERGAFFLEPYNPAYYPRHWELAGFSPCRSYISSAVDAAACAQSLEREYARSLAAGYTHRTFDRARFDEELALMFDLSTRIFTGSWMWRPVAFEEFKALYAGLKGIMDPGLCFFLFKGDEPVGFLFGLPDYGPAVRAMGGSRSLLAKARFWLKRNQAPQALLKTFGVVPGRRQGANALALCHLFHRAAVERGYSRAVHALMRDDNTSLRMSERHGGETLKRYALYEYRDPIS
ncbi:hypothetical protein J7643_14560 [bacterium]|nr:hypothetical protein [bacterium]